MKLACHTLHIKVVDQFAAKQKIIIDLLMEIQGDFLITILQTLKSFNYCRKVLLLLLSAQTIGKTMVVELSSALQQRK
jgi:hypothetical protein